MFTSILGDLKGWFGRAFVLAVWFPVFVFASAAAVYLAGAGGLAAYWAAWARLGADEKVILSAEFVLAVTPVAFALDYAQVSVTRVFEGYW